MLLGCVCCAGVPGRGAGSLGFFWSKRVAGTGTKSLGDPSLWKEGEKNRDTGYGKEMRRPSMERGGMEAEPQSWGAGGGLRSGAEESAGWGLEAVWKSGR